jgi:hypothetical protein
MGFHQINRLLLTNGNNYQNEEITHRIGENMFARYSLDNVLISRIYKELKN